LEIEEDEILSSPVTTHTQSGNVPSRTWPPPWVVAKSGGRGFWCLLAWDEVQISSGGVRKTISLGVRRNWGTEKRAVTTRGGKKMGGGGGLSVADKGGGFKKQFSVIGNFANER